MSLTRRYYVTVLRRLFTITAAVSLPMCVVLCIVWYRTSLTPGSVSLDAAQHPRHQLVYEHGEVALQQFGSNAKHPESEVSIAYLAMVYPLMFVMGLWFLTFLDGRGSRPGMCRVCGYDLRASADRCPECGTCILQESRVTG